MKYEKGKRVGKRCGKKQKKSLADEEKKLLTKILLPDIEIYKENT